MNHMNFKMFLRLIRQGIRNQRNRMAVGVFCVFIGVTVVSSLINLYYDISYKMHEELKSHGANFFVGSKTYSVSPTLDQSVLDLLIKTITREKIVAISPFLYGIARLDLGNAVLVGVDFPEFKKLERHWPIVGQWVSMSFDDRHCVVGRTLANTMHLKVGDSLTVYSQDLNTHAPLTIKGIIETGESADEQVFVNLPLAQRILGLEGKVHHAMLRVEVTGTEAEHLARFLEKTIPFIKADALKRVSYSEGKILESMTGLMTLMVSTIVVLMTLVLMTTLTAMTAFRRKEIALMKALGAKNRSILSYFTVEIILIVLVGTILGIPAGFILAQIFGKTIFLSFVSFRLIVIPFTLAIMSGTAVLAAIIPIRRAYRLDTALVLKEE